jgi:hypothetical protein
MFRNIAFFLAGGLIAASFIGGVAHAITSTVFSYSAVKTGYYGLSPLKFVPVGYQDAAGYADVSAGGFQSLQLANGNAQGCFNTGVDLPQGAKITSFAMWYSTDTVEGVGAVLLRAKFAYGTDDVIANIVSADTSQTRQHRAATVAASATATVDNGHYVYSALVCLNSAAQQSRYYAGRITYTYTSAGD